MKRIPARLFMALPAIFLFASGRPAGGATYTVTSAANSGAGTLRAAISNANANAGRDMIVFNLPAGSLTISVNTDLPRVTDRTTIVATNQPGFSNAPLVTVRAASSSLTNGLLLGAPGCTVTAIRVHGFSSGILATSPSCVIQS